MATIIHDCPHCGAKCMAFTVLNDFPVPGIRDAYAVGALCGGCQKPICAVFIQTAIPKGRGITPKAYGGNLLSPESNFVRHAIYPGVNDDSPDNIPVAVASAYRQGSGSRNAGHFDAACGMYRRAMELALKEFSPDIEAWQIEKRINKMAAENRITPELKAWAHELRIDGNDAMHGVEDATAEMAHQMHEFCRFLLIYLYTLPAQVRTAQARRNE